MLMVSVILFQSHAFNHVQVFSWQKVLSKCWSFNQAGSRARPGCKWRKPHLLSIVIIMDWFHSKSNEKSGLEYINEAINRLSLKHQYHMENYGSGNELRMTGLHETSSYDKFNFGVANRGASVRIPTKTKHNEKGYFEDRRPSSNMDPYLVSSIIFETTVLN